jgi:hypothetical protein
VQLIDVRTIPVFPGDTSEIVAAVTRLAQIGPGDEADALAAVIVAHVTEDYFSLPKIAQELDVKRQRPYQMVQEGKFRRVFRLEGDGERPAAYLVAASEVRAMAAEPAALAS